MLSKETIICVSVLLLLITTINYYINRRKAQAQVQEQQSPEVKNNIYWLQFDKILSKYYTNFHQIPLDVYQTYSIPLPNIIKKAMDILKNQNPDFDFHFYDDEMCRDFIRKHFSEKVLKSFDTLIPGAYKADLWRYCILYQYGGIYLDIKFVMASHLRLRNFVDKEYYVRDTDSMGRNRGEFVYQAFLVARPKNELYKKCIEQIVEYVEKRDTRKCDLDITGPEMFGRKIRENMDYLVERGNLNIKDFRHTGNGNIYFKKEHFLKVYKKKEYYNIIDNNNRYGRLWPNIYKG